MLDLIIVFSWISRLRSKFAEDCQRLEFGEQDEESFLKKMRKAAQNYAVDSAMYSESLLV